MAFDPTGGQIDEKQLKWGYWWVTHQVQVRKAFTIALGVVAGLLVAYAAWGFIDWFFVTGPRERAQMGLIRYTDTPVATFRAYGAKEQIIIDDAFVLPAGEGRYDVMSRVTNPNEEWTLTFDYRFDVAGARVVAKRGFLLPGETKFLAALGVAAESRPSSPPLEISNVVWKRVDPHLVYPSYAQWAAQRQQLLVTDVAFTPPAATDALPISRARFTVTNDSAFSYYSVGFFVTLQAGPSIVGAQYVTISGLRAGERRQVEATWFNDLPTVTRVEVEPDVNILDPKVYIAPGQ